MQGGCGRIRQANAGIAVARNASVQAARGDYIALLDTDDLCRPDRIAIELRYLQSHPDVKGQTLRTLLKIAMPSGVLNRLRSMRTRAI